MGTFRTQSTDGCEDVAKLGRSQTSTVSAASDFAFPLY